ncbi:MAG: DUF2490 domain-containing protein [Flavobacteriaceae bacterium]
MSRKIIIVFFFIFLWGSYNGQAQIDQQQSGAWYMYFFNTRFGESQWGLQGDIQYRNWNLMGDLEQLLIRAGMTYRPKNSPVLLTLGYGNITTGAFGDADDTTHESRIYQEALYPIRLGKRLYTNHRFRYEQRFVENQDTRTRYRYNLFLNIPLNKTEITDKTVYIALYNELFINGQRDIGNGARVEVFDRNRFYSALGYQIKQGLKAQLGWMRQSTDRWQKNQLQLSLHHSF